MRMKEWSAGAVVMGLNLAGVAWGADLRVGLATEATSIDPHFASLAQNIQVSAHIFEPLVTTDANQRLKPRLAASWAPIDDKTWELKLRSGVKWHDGAPFTADDAVATFGRLHAGIPNTPSPVSPYVAGKLAVKVDDHTLHIRTEAPYPLLPNDLTRVFIVSKKHAKEGTTEDYNRGTVVVGTGPYRFRQWVSGDRIDLEANPAYWAGRPKWERVVLKAVKAGPSRIAALLSGDLEVIEGVPTTDVAALKANANIALVQTASNRVIYLHLDSNRDVSPFVKDRDGSALSPNPLRDPRVRKAISLAVSREALVERVMEGAAVPASQMLPEGAFGYIPELGPERHDPDQARRLLKEAGYPEGFGMTIHGPNGVYLNDGKMLEAIAQMLARVGIRSEVVTLPGSAYFTRASRGGERGLPEFSLILNANASNTGDASDPLKTIIHSYNKEAGFGAFNRGRYSNVRFDAIVQEALVTLDDAKRERLYHEATRIASNDVAVIPLFHPAYIWALRKGLSYEARRDGLTLADGVAPGK